MNEDLDKLISRRTLLKGAAAVTCVALASEVGRAVPPATSNGASSVPCTLPYVPYAPCSAPLTSLLAI